MQPVGCEDFSSGSNKFGRATKGQGGEGEEEVEWKTITFSFTGQDITAI